MGRAPCCDKANVKKGPWSPEEDAKLKDFINKYGPAANWIALPQKAGLKRCGKSCRLRWLNYLRPNIKHGQFSQEEDTVISTLYATIGSRWSIIASQLPGRTDNDIKNYWNTKLKKKILGTRSNQPPFSFPIQTPTTPAYISNLCTSFYDEARKSLSSSAAITPYPQNINHHLHYSNSTRMQHEGFEDFSGGYYPIKDNMLVFGPPPPASCSSSDGSCSQISYGGGVKIEETGISQGFIENRSSFAVEDPILDHHKHRNGVLESNSQLQYDLDQVSHLITSGGGGGFMFGDDNKCGEMGLYYF